MGGKRGNTHGKMEREDFCLDQQGRQWTEGRAQILLGVPGNSHQDGML